MGAALTFVDESVVCHQTVGADGWGACRGFTRCHPHLPAQEFHEFILSSARRLVTRLPAPFCIRRYIIWALSVLGNHQLMAMHLVSPQPMHY